MTTVELLHTLKGKKPEITDYDIDTALAGNLCRCGTYQRIRRAVKTAAKNAGFSVRGEP